MNQSGLSQRLRFGRTQGPMYKITHGEGAGARFEQSDSRSRSISSVDVSGTRPGQ
jgi:hypothetical protein